MRRALVSPHLDDAVLSCFAALGPGSSVITVFTGGPDSDELHSTWDAGCGARSSRELMDRRRTEDLAACTAAGAHPVHLPFRQRHYGEDISTAELAAALAPELAGADEVWLPAGVGGHPDHVRARAAAFAALPAHAAVWIYAEYPYHQHVTRWSGAPSPVAALAAWFAGQLGSAAVPTAIAADPETKRAAVRCYASQLGSLQATVDGTLLDDGPLGAEYAWLARRSEPR